MRETTRDGLEGVVVAETQLSDVDGEAGRLRVRGHDVETLAGRVPFEAAATLLLEGRLPDGEEAAAAARAVGEGRARAFAALPRATLARVAGMDALRGGVAALRAPDDPAEARALLLGAVGTFAAAWWRLRAGGQPVAPDPTLGHAEDVLRMSGGATDAPRVRAFDRYLVAVAEHGMNASTFAARVVASTGSDAVSAVTAALGALAGPLHGGAPGPVLDMLDAIGAPEHAAAWLEGELAAGRRIMGLGHRVYRVRDPRAAVLEAGVADLEAAGVRSHYLPLARAVEKQAVDALASRHPERRLEANVEFYTAVILDAVGLHREAFTTAFATARVAGWLAHVEEQRRSGRLIRPRQRYVGPAPAAVAG
jgi:citrate synthase